MDVTASSEVVVGLDVSDEVVPVLEVVVGSCSIPEVDGVSTEVELGLRESDVSGVLVDVVRPVVGEVDDVKVVCWETLVDELDVVFS